MRTIVYIDGFNLYYRALRDTAHKWLDIQALCHATMPRDADILQVNYYTARVSGRVDPGAPVRQHAYLRALETLPLVTLHFGNFLAKPKWAGLVQPPEFRPEHQLPDGVVLSVAKVWRTEEKGSDVNLGVHLVRDAALGKMDQAAILTNDTDLVEPLRITKDEFGIRTILLTPVSRPATSLQRVSTSVRHVDTYLGPCQLPDTITASNGRVIRKPEGW